MQEGRASPHVGRPAFLHGRNDRAQKTMFLGPHSETLPLLFGALQTGSLNIEACMTGHPPICLGKPELERSTNHLFGICNRRHVFIVTVASMLLTSTANGSPSIVHRSDRHA